jgi:hypothetical protein
MAAVSAGCATSPRKNMMIGAGGGAAMGAVGGALLSPNRESRGINTLVFGLVGALAGGLATLLFGAEDQVPPGQAPVPPLTADSAFGAATDEHYITRPNQELPDFVRERLVPVVVEELNEPEPWVKMAPFTRHTKFIASSGRPS